jgi:hypothetical protein
MYIIYNPKTLKHVEYEGRPTLEELHKIRNQGLLMFDDFMELKFRREEDALAILQRDMITEFEASAEEDNVDEVENSVEEDSVDEIASEIVCQELETKIENNNRRGRKKGFKHSTNTIQLMKNTISKTTQRREIVKDKLSEIQFKIMNMFKYDNGNEDEIFQILDNVMTQLIDLQNEKVGE